MRSLVKKIQIWQDRIINFIKERRTVKLLHVFRGYSALIVVICSALLVAFTNFAAGKESSGFLFGYFGSGDNFDNPVDNKISVQANNNKNNLTLARLAEASTAPDPALRDSIDSETVMNVQGQAVVAGMSPVRKDPEEDGGVNVYEVQPGDTVGSIAAKNNIKVQTILWANALDNVDSIMPGDKIFILPSDGLSYSAKKGESLDAIAQKFKADKSNIIAANTLPANGELKEDQDLLIPDGQKDIPKPVAPLPSATPTPGGIAARPYESFGSAGKNLAGNPSNGHDFPYGYCTWYVAQKKYIPWSGNAGTWLYKAKAAGYATGRAPRAGSILVTSESWWGHVALVEKVNGDGTFTVSEMNYKGFAKKSFRDVDASSRVIKGFIYTQ